MRTTHYMHNIDKTAAAPQKQWQPVPVVPAGRTPPGPEGPALAGLGPRAAQCVVTFPDLFLKSTALSRAVGAAFSAGVGK